jgi:hypothetical protein
MNKEDKLIEEVLGAIVQFRQMPILKGNECKGFGINYAKSLIDLVRGREWVSVEDELPETKGQYDVCGRTGRVVDHWFNGEYFISPRVTHWRERPSPPTK